MKITEKVFIKASFLTTVKNLNFLLSVVAHGALGPHLAQWNQSISPQFPQVLIQLQLNLSSSLVDGAPHETWPHRERSIGILRRKKWLFCWIRVKQQQKDTKQSNQTKKTILHIAQRVPKLNFCLFVHTVSYFIQFKEIYENTWKCLITIIHKI